MKMCYVNFAISTAENCPLCYQGVTSSPSQRLSIRWEHKRLAKTLLPLDESEPINFRNWEMQEMN